MSLGPEPVSRRHLGRAGGALAAHLALGASGRPAAAWAGGAPVVAILRTAAAVDRAASAAYDLFLSLEIVTQPPVNQPVVALLEATRRHHDDHVAAFDDALARRGTTPPTASNRFVAGLTPDRVRLTSLRAVLDTALAVERVVAATAQQAVGLLEEVTARDLAAAVAGVEAQHVAILAVYRALLDEGGLAVIAAPENSPTKLPPATVKAGLAAAFTSTEGARPPGEGTAR